MCLYKFSYAAINSHVLVTNTSVKIFTEPIKTCEESFECAIL